jgi:hypothetical protein
MKNRRVFSAPSVAVAEVALRQAVAVGIDPAHAALIGRSEIEVAQVPDDEKEAAPTDFKPAALRGLAGGAALGLVLGLLAMLVPAVGIHGAGVALCVVIGGCVGMWAASLAGSAVPSEVRRDYRREIEAGEVLLVIDDADDALLERASAAVLSTAGIHRLQVLPHGLLQ